MIVGGGEWTVDGGGWTAVSVSFYMLVTFKPLKGSNHQSRKRH